MFDPDSVYEDQQLQPLQSKLVFNLWFWLDLEVYWIFTVVRMLSIKMVLANACSGKITNEIIQKFQQSFSHGRL